MDSLKKVIEQFSPGNEQEARDKEQILVFCESYDDLLTRKNGLLHFTASAWTMNPNRDKVLMVYHNIYQAWSWVGGHADGDENLLSVAERELKEETGIKECKLLFQNPISLELIGVQPHEKKGRYVPPHLHLNLTYFFEVAENQPLVIKADENAGVQWRDIASVYEDNTEPHMRVIYRKILNRIKSNAPS